jgi:adenine-specific DNA methylase
VDFPIAQVSVHAAREKSIRHGHPSTLHLWWARRPLASSRAVLMALLLPDPCDPHCPEAFKGQAREILAEVRQPPKDDEELRKALLWFIASFTDWDNAAHPVYLRVARNLVQAAWPEEPPLVVDPFAGGGSIPLEALRLGCEAFASDLNPVASVVENEYIYIEGYRRGDGLPSTSGVQALEFVQGLVQAALDGSLVAAELREGIRVIGVFRVKASPRPRFCILKVS